VISTISADRFVPMLDAGGGRRPRGLPWRAPLVATQIPGPRLRRATVIKKVPSPLVALQRGPSSSGLLGGQPGQRYIGAA